MRMHLSEIMQGFFLGGLIVAIGAQNVFVLSQSLKGNHEWLIATIFCMCDIVLIILGIGVLGLLLQTVPSLTKWIVGFSIVFLFVYGLLSFRSMLNCHKLEASEHPRLTMKKLVLLF